MARPLFSGGRRDERRRTAVSPERIDQDQFGPHGNCQSACLAMLLGLPLSGVPNWSAMEELTDNQKYAAQLAWLRERGWMLLTLVPMQVVPWPPRHGFYIAGGPSPRGFRHSVIYEAGKMWHDPHPDRGGISEVQDIDVLVPLWPHRTAVHSQGNPA